MSDTIFCPDDFVFGLDIGTRNVVGTVGYMKNGRFQAAAIVSKEHETRAMLDGQIHDIGKVGIDESILNKPGKLTKEEFETMKEHTLIGASMLDKLEHYKDEKMIKIAYQICRWHHERYDGKGYPDGLTGEQIPIAAQVVSVADVYDALV